MLVITKNIKQRSCNNANEEKIIPNDKSTEIG